MLITNDHLLDKGFSKINTLKETGIEEYSLTINGVVLFYFFKVSLMPLGYKEMYGHYPDGTHAFFGKIQTEKELQELLLSINNKNHT